jgi:hypothetical protein
LAELKTKPTKNSVKDFLNQISDEQRRKDSKVIVKLMSDLTGAKPEMWGPSIVGFGRRRYQYSSGREGEWMIIGFSPRKNDLTLYIAAAFEGRPDLIKRLGKHRTGKGCLYIKKLDDIDLKVLNELIEESVTRLSSNRIDK